LVDAARGENSRVASASRIQYVSGYGKAVLLTMATAAVVYLAGEQSPAAWFGQNDAAGKHWAEEVCPCARLDDNNR
jgi:hypothetical protein